MNEIIAGLVLTFGIASGWKTARKTGLLSPASVYIWFMSIDLALFLLIAYTHANRANFIFTAMPWPPFDSVILPTTLIYGFLISVGWLSSVKLKVERKKPVVAIRSTGKSREAQSMHVNKQNLYNLLVFFWILVLFMEISHFLELDKSVLWQTQDHLALIRPSSAGIHSLTGRLIHFLLRPLGLLLVGGGTFFWIRHRRFTGFLFLLLSIYPFLLAFAANSRWAPLYIAGMLVVIVFFGGIKRYFFPMIVGGAIGSLIYLKVLIGRITPYQGLSGTSDVFRIIFLDVQPWRWIVGFFLNVFLGAQGLANSLLIHPRYPAIYKLLSFSPTISAIDHFDKINELYLVKIAPAVPMNAYSEAFFFGWPYLIFLLAIMIVWLRTMTKLYLRKDSIGTAFTIFSYWAIFYISQYPVRSSVRLIYLSLLIGILVNRVVFRYFSKPILAEVQT